MNKRFDPFGVLILATVTAVGGGTLRDVLIGRTPVGWMNDINYSYIILTAVVVTLLFRGWLRYFRRTMFLFDAIGLGLFTIIGVELGLDYGLHPGICVMLGTMSASFGGVIRDILSTEIPLVFHKEVYASLSILGAILYLLFLRLDMPTDMIYLSTSIIIVILRILAVRRHWVIPLMYK
ncbi:UNVERIFIED_CONTAM: hypothetical protein GTU68_050820 [Idotea baltica]|nr:hypothetical protein [Idotea baltica]